MSDRFLIGKSARQGPTAKDGWLAIIATTGDCGVSLFFMISGFILALPWLGPDRRPALGAYFWRRLTRLEPPYLLSLVGLTIAYYLTKHEPTPGLIQHLLVSMAYPHTLIFNSLNPVNCVTWSLKTEIQFYALLPLIALVLFRATPAIRRHLAGARLVRMRSGVLGEGFVAAIAHLIWIVSIFHGRHPHRRPRQGWERENERSCGMLLVSWVSFSADRRSSMAGARFFRRSCSRTL